MSKLQKFKISLRPKQRLALFLAVLVLVFVLLCATVFRDDMSSAFRRITVSHQDSFPHNAQANSLFYGLEDNLLVCSQGQIQILSPGGEQRLKESISMLSPALNLSDEYAVVYDVGGNELRLLEGDELTQELTLPEDSTLLCATVNSRGWVAVVSRVGGYKGVVTVYNADFEEVLSIKLSSRYISDAVVTPDCHGVYLISPGQAGGKFENTLLFYTMSAQEEPSAEVSLGSNVVLSIRSSKKCWVLGDRQLFVLDSSGYVSATYDYGGMYLRMASLQGNAFAALLLSTSSAGTGGTLVTVNASGEECGRMTVTGQPLSLAAKNHDVVLLTTGEILSCPRSLDYAHVEPNQLGTRNVAIYDDGGIALVGSGTVSLTYSSQGERRDNPKEEETKENEETATQNAGEEASS